MDNLFIALQYIVPQHLLSRAVGWLAETEWSMLKNLLIRAFISQYKVNMSEAARAKPEDYRNFNDFFTRELKGDARPFADATGWILQPADGAVSQIGPIESGKIFQAKGQHYSAAELLDSDAWAADFHDGDFATIYLSPKDYHRIHMPIAGTLTGVRYVPGDLFSVNQVTAENVPSLFARNERLVCMFDTEHGKMALVMVGAMIVAGIETVWGEKMDATATMPAETIEFAAGDELGRFYLGSTVILLFEPEQIEWLEGLAEGAPVTMGEALAKR